MTDLTSWVAIMAHGMFYTDFVATAVYGGQPDAAPGSVYDLLFDEGVGLINKFGTFYNFAIRLEWGLGDCCCTASQLESMLFSSRLKSPRVVHSCDSIL